ncbi:hypothetical protein [Streptomyces tauricus]|uniref:hypothetical protein n=1 Tax=Streptomyces tauricus TaxID=68274 RepID=UPI002243D7C9|nr:hypothetical protein [Streptomyces tauricus]MCW8100379.1 hypothetical protein [Streptomyces tauricus]
MGVPARLPSAVCGVFDAFARHSVECVAGYKHTAAGRLGQSCLMPSTAVYTSPAMVRDGAVVSMATALDLAGPVTATLTVSTDGPSAHVFLKVCDVVPTASHA